jgi:hypothetical protein
VLESLTFVAPSFPRPGISPLLEGVENLVLLHHSPKSFTTSNISSTPPSHVDPGSSCRRPAKNRRYLPPSHSVDCPSLLIPSALVLRQYPPQAIFHFPPWPFELIAPSLLERLGIGVPEHEHEPEPALDIEAGPLSVFFCPPIPPH